ncbi:RNA-directed DNA polymerase from mobile element jockey [Frankliniella fusca]|uniref:RNA-directed DNA polymerase from mobile element jockey n=1 Tax=Frankliniella fusca TaxID=407009 RepID=A0AAE1GX63_9NEOP|nr:RNA-directed DNA polymerase from mobile element jockey [Frankliniella fusca]
MAKAESLEQQVGELQDENQGLRQQVVALEERLTAAEQYSRVNDVDVHGIPYKKGENLNEILNSLSQALAVPLSSDRVEIAHRTGPPDASRRGIIVRFFRKTDKIDFIKARKVKRDLAVKHLSVFGESHPSRDDIIHVNESLSVEMRKMLNFARSKKKGGTLNSAWVDNGKLYIKKNEHKKILKIGKDFPQALKIVHFNAQSLIYQHHATEFQILFDNSDMDVIAVSETFFNNNNDVLHLAGFNTFTASRTSHEGGGVAVYVKNGFQCKVLSCSTSPAQRIQQPDYIIIEILLKECKLLFACVYRPPKAGHFNIFSEDFFQLCTDYVNCIVVGDVNAHFDSQRQCDITDGKLVNNFIEECNLTHVPFGPTFHLESCHSRLDMITSSVPERLLHFDQFAACGFSAHDFLVAVFSFTTPKFTAHTATFRDFKRFNPDEFTHDVANAPWEEMFCSGDINDKVEIFNRLYNKLLDTHAPVKTIVVKHRPKPWITADILNLLQQRDAAYVYWRKSKQYYARVLYVKLRNKAKSECRNAKVRFAYSKLINCTSPKALWKTLRDLDVTPKKVTFSPVPNVNELNRHYTNVSCADVALVNDYISTYDAMPAYHVDEPFHFKHIFFNDLQKALMGISSNAKGVDGISATVLKLCLPEFSPALLHLFNYSLQCCTFPNVWKVANVKPLPKKPGASTVNEFRPISLLCILGKILEKIKVTTFPKIVVDGVALDYSPTVNDLGVIIDETLSWGPQLVSIGKKVLAALHGLRRHQQLLPPPIRKRLVEALIFPVFDYCNTVCSNALVKPQLRLQSLQNSCARFVLNLKNDNSSMSPHINKLSWLKVSNRPLYASQVLLKNILCNKSPEYLFEHLVKESDIRSRPVRNCNLHLRVPLHRTDRHKGTFWIHAASEWNKLPCTLHSCKNLPTFKVKLKQHLLKLQHSTM